LTCPAAFPEDQNLEMVDLSTLGSLISSCDVNVVGFDIEICKGVRSKSSSHLSFVSRNHLSTWDMNEEETRALLSNIHRGRELGLDFYLFSKVLSSSHLWK